MIPLPTTSDLDQAIQLAIAGVLAGAVGWQRHHVGRPAGLRTHAMVAMAAAAFTVAGIDGFSGAGPRDPTRIAGQVASGIGFLGAGTIFRAEDHVLGLTTAATLWFAAALGVLVASGLLWLAIFATLIALVLLTIGRFLER